MWVITIRSPWQEPREHILRAGQTTLGRKADNDIVIADESASRLHAAIEHDAAAGSLILRDLDSTNGTYVNRERLRGSQPLSPDDQIRIGQHTLTVSRRTSHSAPSAEGRLPLTQPITRDLVLESVDQHALVLYEVSHRLNAILDLEPALAEVAKLTCTALGASHCAVIPAKQFHRLAELGFPSAVAHQAVEQRAVVWVSDLAAAPADTLGSVAARPPAPIRSLVCVPGLMGDEVIALTYAFRTGDDARPFDQHDVRLAVAISHQAALTVQRAGLVSTANRREHLAQFDGVTELPNRRRLLELGEPEFARARRYRRPLSAMLIDVDGFKQINARHGRLVGDQVLRSVAQRCRGNMREQHLLSRYGNDELAGLLLEAGRLEAEVVAERLRRRVAEAPFNTEAGPLSVTISTGCAALTDDCANLTSLLSLAEAAAQQARRARES